MRERSGAQSRRRRRRERIRRARRAPPRAPADDDRRRQRSARLPNHGLARPQSRRRGAPVCRDARAGDEGGGQARLSAGTARRRARRVAAASIGFICDEISTDPWTSIGLDGVREKAWERGLTVSVMATRGDADMESAALAQLTRPAAARSDLRDHQHPAHRCARRASGDADGAAELPCRQRRAAVGRAGRSRRRPRRDRRSASAPAIAASATSTAKRAWRPRAIA